MSIDVPQYNRYWTDQYRPDDSYENEIARGRVRTAYPVVGYGKLIAGAGVTRTLIQDQDGTVLHVPPTTGQQMQLVSSSASDIAGGTGARTIVIEYLDHNLDLAFELIALNGLTPVNTIATDIRWVQAIHVATVGSGGVAAGNIDIKNTNTYARIAAGQRSSHSSFRRVPRGKTLYISTMFAGSSSGSAATSSLIELVTTQIDGLDQQETGFFYSQAGIVLQDASQTLTMKMPLPVGPGHIVGFMATCDKGATITAGFTGWVE